MRLSFPLLIFFLLIGCGDDPQPVSPIEQTIDPETPVGSGNNDVLVCEIMSTLIFFLSNMFAKTKFVKLFPNRQIFIILFNFINKN